MFSPLISYVWIEKLSTTWRTCYYWCIAWEALAAILLFFFYFPPSFDTKYSVDKKTRRQLIMELDYVGLVLFSAACVLLLLAINWVSPSPLPCSALLWSALI